MDRAIVFGVGKNYKKYRNSIESFFEVVALIDNNYENVSPGFPCEILPVDRISDYEYDYIIITTFFYQEMYNQLIEMGIERDSIIIWELSDYSNVNVSCGLRCFGQHFDDLIIAALFGRLGIEHPTYLDLGSNHPYKGNNTALLYSSGSKGVNVDANPILIDKFKKERPTDVNLNVGVAAEEGELCFYIFDDTSGLNTFSKDEVKKRIGESGREPKEKMVMPVITLEKVIDKYCNGCFPDFLDCDIEGLDYEVLASYDFSKNGPKVICVEVRNNDIEKFDSLLKSQGYFSFCRIGANSIYVRNELKAKIMN